MAGWTSPRTWVAGEKPSAATMNAHIRDNLNALNGFVRKTADESVTSSTTLQNDNHLALSIPAAGTYEVDVKLFATSAANAAGDLQAGFTFPAGTMHFGIHAADTSLVSGSTTATMAVTSNLSATSGSSVVTAGLSTSTVLIWIHGLFIATATGTLTLQWAQFASNANASTVKSGSHMSMVQRA